MRLALGFFNSGRHEHLLVAFISPIFAHGAFFGMSEVVRERTFVPPLAIPVDKELARHSGNAPLVAHCFQLVLRVVELVLELIFAHFVIFGAHFCFVFGILG